MSDIATRLASHGRLRELEEGSFHHDRTFIQRTDIVYISKTYILRVEDVDEPNHDKRR